MKKALALILSVTFLASRYIQSYAKETTIEFNKDIINSK